MKKIITILFVFSALCSYAQEEAPEIKTLVNKENMKSFFRNCYENGIYISQEVRFSTINKEPGASHGFSTGVFLSDNFALGVFKTNSLSHYPFVASSNFDQYFEAKVENKNWGITADYIFFPEKSIHFSVPVRIGWGKLKVIADDRYNMEYYDVTSDNNRIESSYYGIVEPGLNLDLNLIGQLKCRIGASYKVALKSNLINFSDDDLSGVSVNFNLTYKFF